MIQKNCNISFKSKFEGNNKICENVILGNVDIGYGTYIGSNSKFYNTKIGRYCSIGENVSLVVGRHPTTKYVSTHPAFYSLLKQAGFTYTNQQQFLEEKFISDKLYLEIGNDVWIGEGVKFISGIRIADGTIIGAGAVVTKDTEPYSIYVGVPAQKIKDRFEEYQKLFLLNLKWWNKSEEWLKEKVNLFCDIDKLMKKEREYDEK